MSNPLSFYKLLPNRVWRTYTGGKQLDVLEGKEKPTDTFFPEDWIFSTTQAVNVGREKVIEGFSQVELSTGESVLLTKLIDQDPDGMLGADMTRKYGKQAMVLVKYLDAAIRLHFQAHPTKEFSKKYLGVNAGKTEAYHILSIRPEQKEPYIYIGFQRPPSVSELKALIERQDISVIEKYFDKIPVQVGDTFIIPGGRPHAIGEGLMMVEVMEPTDLVVRFEFEKAGYVLPESARFINRGIDFGLSLFNFEPLSQEEVLKHSRVQPLKVLQLNTESWTEELIGPAQTDCFRIEKTIVKGKVEKKKNTYQIGIVTKGELRLRKGQEELVLKEYEKYFLPASLLEYEIESRIGAEVLEIYPPLS